MQRLLVCVLCFVLCVAYSTQVKASFEKGMKLFQSFQFDQAIPAFEAALKTNLSKAQRVKVLVLLSLSHYNQANPDAAANVFHKALVVSPAVKLPTGQAPAVYQHYEGLRRRWLQRNASSKSKVRKVPVRNVVRTPVAPARRVAKAPKKRPALPPAKASFWQRHTASVVLVGLALVAGGVGVGLGVVASGQNAALQNELDQKAITGAELGMKYEEALPVGLTATILLASSGALFLIRQGLSIVVQDRSLCSHYLVCKRRGTHQLWRCCLWCSANASDRMCRGSRCEGHRVHHVPTHQRSWGWNKKGLGRRMCSYSRAAREVSGNRSRMYSLIGSSNC